MFLDTSIKNVTAADIRWAAICLSWSINLANYYKELKAEEPIMVCNNSLAAMPTTTWSRSPQFTQVTEVQSCGVSKIGLCSSDQPLAPRPKKLVSRDSLARFLCPSCMVGLVDQNSHCWKVLIFHRLSQFYLLLNFSLRRLMDKTFLCI
jgi:hypothetical protein